MNLGTACLLLLAGCIGTHGSSFDASELPALEVVLRGNDSVKSGVTRTYHDGYCEIHFPTSGSLWSQIVGSEGLWHIDFAPNTNSFCSDNTDPDQVRYKLQRDGNFFVRCRGSLDYMTHSHQGEVGDYVMAIDHGCMLHIFEGIMDCNRFDIQREIWSSDRYEPLGPGDRLYKGQVLHRPSYMMLEPDTGNFELRQELSHGTYEVIYSADWEWDAPPGPELHDYYAKITDDGYLELVGIEYGSTLKEKVYFSKDLHSNGASCFTLGYEPSEEYLGPVDLKAIPCHETDLTLIAKYDWINGGEDVSESDLEHDANLGQDTSTEDGILYIHTDWAQVDLGVMPELNGATKVLFRFEDVGLEDFPGSGVTGRYTVLLGGGDDQWWVGVRHKNSDEVGTYLAFNIGGWDDPNYDFEVKISDDFLTIIDSIEYRYDGTVLPGKRLAIRHNNGVWKEGGWSNYDHFENFPFSDETVRINDGARADWDDGLDSVGTVSIFASQ